MSSKVNLLTPSCGEQKYSVGCWALSNGVGDKPHIQSNLAFDVESFLKGRTKVIVVLGIRMCLINDSLAGLSMAWSLLAHLALGKQPGFVH